MSTTVPVQQSNVYIQELGTKIDRLESSVQTTMDKIHSISQSKTTQEVKPDQNMTNIMQTYKTQNDQLKGTIELYKSQLDTAVSKLEKKDDEIVRLQGQNMTCIIQTYKTQNDQLKRSIDFYKSQLDINTIIKLEKKEDEINR